MNYLTSFVILLPFALLRSQARSRHRPTVQKEIDARKFILEHYNNKMPRFKDITLDLLHSLDNPE